MATRTFKYYQDGFYQIIEIVYIQCRKTILIIIAIVKRMILKASIQNYVRIRFQNEATVRRTMVNYFRKKNQTSKMMHVGLYTCMYDVRTVVDEERSFFLNRVS